MRRGPRWIRAAQEAHGIPETGSTACTAGEVQPSPPVLTSVFVTLTTPTPQRENGAMTSSSSATAPSPSPLCSGLWGAAAQGEAQADDLRFAGGEGVGRATEFCAHQPPPRRGLGPRAGVRGCPVCCSPASRSDLPSAATVPSCLVIARDPHGLVSNLIRCPMGIRPSYGSRMGHADNRLLVRYATPDANWHPYGQVA